MAGCRLGQFIGNLKFLGTEQNQKTQAAQIPDTSRRISGAASRKDGTKLAKRTIARPTANAPPVKNQSFLPTVATPPQR